jgi:hypothetical protein
MLTCVVVERCSTGQPLRRVALAERKLGEGVLTCDVAGKPFRASQRLKENTAVSFALCRSDVSKLKAHKP